jgi:hypothetical protein
MLSGFDRKFGGMQASPSLHPFFIFLPIFELFLSFVAIFRAKSAAQKIRSNWGFHASQQRPKVPFSL